jgi:predicted helicase
VHEVIEAFRNAPSNSERGTKFEELMVRYSELDPMLSQQYDAVWRRIDWPDCKGKTDAGIDLVARERDIGNYAAIQCKFYEPTHTLSKGDIELVLAFSDAAERGRRSTDDKAASHGR